MSPRTAALQRVRARVQQQQQAHTASTPLRPHSSIGKGEHGGGLSSHGRLSAGYREQTRDGESPEGSWQSTPHIRSERRPDVQAGAGGDLLGSSVDNHGREAWGPEHDPQEVRHQREMIKVHGLWKKAASKVEVLEGEMARLADAHAQEKDAWRHWQMEEERKHARELDKLEAHLAQLRKDAAAQVHEWQDRLHRLGTELEKSEDERQRECRRREEEQARSSELESELRRFQGLGRVHSDDLQFKMSTLRGDKEALEAENRSVTNALRAKGEQLDNALRQLEHVEAALDTAAQDGRRLHNKLAAAQEEAEAAQAEAKQARMQLAHVEAEMSVLRAANETLRGELDVANRQLGRRKRGAGGQRGEDGSEMQDLRAAVTQLDLHVQHLSADKERLLSALETTDKFAELAKSLRELSLDHGELHFVAADGARGKRARQQIQAKWDDARRAANVEAVNWVPRQVLLMAAEYQRLHLSQTPLHHIEALVATLNSVWQKIAALQVAQHKEAARRKATARKREENAQTPMNYMALQKQNERLQKQLKMATQRAAGAAAGPGELASSGAHGKAPIEDGMQYERLGLGHKTYEQAHKELAQQVAQLLQDNRALRWRVTELSVAAGNLSSAAGAPAPALSSADLGRGGAGALGAREVSVLAPAVARHLQSDDGDRAFAGEEDGDLGWHARVSRSFTLGLREAATPQARDAYRRGAEWLGTHAVFAADALSDKLLPLIKRLHRLGVGVGGDAPSIVNHRLTGSDSPRSSSRFRGFGREGNALVEDAVRIIPQELAILRRRVRALLECALHEASGGHLGEGTRARAHTDGETARVPARSLPTSPLRASLEQRATEPSWVADPRDISLGLTDAAPHPRSAAAARSRSRSRSLSPTPVGSPPAGGGRGGMSLLDTPWASLPGSGHMSGVYGHLSSTGAKASIASSIQRLEATVGPGKGVQKGSFDAARARRRHSHSRDMSTNIRSPADSGPRIRSPSRAEPGSGLGATGQRDESSSSDEYLFRS